MKLYETRVQAKDACIRHSESAERFARATERCAKYDVASNIIWDYADSAKTAVTCAMQAHDELWKLTDGKMTDDEWEAFCKAETVQPITARTARIAAGILKINN